MAKKYDVAAYIWPAYTGKEIRSKIFWPDGIGEWQTVKKHHKKPQHNYEWKRTPLWGYVDEADPKVMEMQINEALKHGVNVFIYDWYWYDNRPFLENCLNDGFLKAKNSLDMKFYIMWANHDAGYTWDYRISSGDDVAIWQGSVTEEQFKIIGKRWIEQYFTKENYYKIDNKPVISIYDLGNFVNGLGGIDKAKENMDWLQNEAKKAGLDGVHFQLVKWGPQPLNLSGVDGGAMPLKPEVVDELGFDSLTHYQAIHFTDLTVDYEQIIPIMEKEWENTVKDFNIPYYPHVSIGWDNNLRFEAYKPNMFLDNTPSKFEKALQKAKDFSDKHCDLPLITINSWNEWTENSYLEPDDLYGYGYLEAVKKVFKEE
ncbi:MAG: glycoside hydrolase family 99-like domain-containing protein [Clostridia bacterium]|nr:glycoside hydrolase family 99-like domain-containing protein [Clostridia bacterium]